MISKREQLMKEARRLSNWDGSGRSESLTLRVQFLALDVAGSRCLSISHRSLNERMNEWMKCSILDTRWGSEQRNPLGWVIRELSIHRTQISASISWYDTETKPWRVDLEKLALWNKKKKKSVFKRIGHILGGWHCIVDGGSPIFSSSPN